MNMDGIIITAAVILGVIALIEIVTLLFLTPIKSAPAYVAVLPIFADDPELSERLEYLSLKGCGRRRIILVNYSADAEQDMLCRQFAGNSPDTLYISAMELEKTLREIFTCDTVKKDVAD